MILEIGLLDKKLKYKMELALSIGDYGGGNSSNFSIAANIILDAAVEYFEEATA